MGRCDGKNVAVGIEGHLVDAHLTVETVNRTGQVMAVVDNVIAASLFKDGVMTRPVDGLVGVGFEDAALIFKRSHRSYGRCGILHPIGVVVTGAGGIGEVVDAVSFEHKGSLEDVLQLSIGYQSFLREELIGSNGKGIVFAPEAGFFEFLPGKKLFTFHFSFFP